MKHAATLVLSAMAIAATFAETVKTASQPWVTNYVGVITADIAENYQPKGDYLTTETDPTAISAQSNTLTAAGVETDYLAQLRGSAVRGGVRIRYSSRDENNLTAYLYNGVAVKRNGVTDDFLFGTTNQYGVVRFRDLEPIITSICLSLMGNIYWQSDDDGKTMDAYYRDAATISNIVSTAVAYIAETRATAYIRIEPDGAAGVYQPDADEMGGVADKAAEAKKAEASDD